MIRRHAEVGQRRNRFLVFQAIINFGLEVDFIDDDHEEAAIPA
jgi:hypothetical protein